MDRSSSSHVSRARLAVGCSIGSFLLVALMSATRGSPLQPELADGAGPNGAILDVVGALGLDGLSPGALPAVSVVAVSFAAVSFLLVLRESWRGGLSVRLVVGLAVAFHVVVVFLPLLVSRDVYSYAMYGRIASAYGANPYVATPADYAADPVFELVGPKWAETPAVYGPGFTLLSSGVTRAVGSLPQTVAAFRAIAVAASLGTLAIVVHVALRVRRERTAFAAAIVGLNPVVLFQSVGSGHNDPLVAVSIAGAMALLLSRRELAATAALTLGTLVKVTAALPLLLLVVVAVARREPGERARALATHAGIAGGLWLVVAAPFLQAKDPTLGMLELAGHEGWLAPSRFLRRVAEAVVGVGDVLGVLVRVAFAVALVVAVVLIARECARRARELDVPAQGAAWGWALLFLVLLGPVLLPWYVTWVLPVAFLLPRVPRAVLIGTSTALAVSQWAAEPSRFPGAYDANILVGHYVITPVVAGLLVWLALDLRRRLRDGTPLEEERQEVPAAAG